MRFALIENGMVKELFEALPEFHPDVMALIQQVTDDTQPGMEQQADGRFAWPTPPAPNFKALAQAALDKSDMTALRCVKAGVAFPPAWLAYCTALRGIVTSGAGPLPVQPEYPAGT